MRMARSRYCGSRYFSQVSAGSSTWPSASTTGALLDVVMVVASLLLVRGAGHLARPPAVSWSWPGRHAGRRAVGRGQRVVAEPLPQRQLVDLAGGGHRHLVHEHHV